MTPILAIILKVLRIGQKHMDVIFPSKIPINEMWFCWFVFLMRKIYAQEFSRNTGTFAVDEDVLIVLWLGFFVVGFFFPF